jgi:hypothetical protein
MAIARCSHQLPDSRWLAIVTSVLHTSNCHFRRPSTPQSTLPEWIPGRKYFVQNTDIKKIVQVQILVQEFADLNNLLDLQTFRKCGTLRICDLRIQFFVIYGLKTSTNPQIHTFYSCKCGICSNDLI